MNEILKKDLCARFPYGVKANILDYKFDYVGNEIDLIVSIQQWSKCGKLWSAETKGGAKPSLDRIKLILFSISCLTKEITVNGETFVPIEEITKMSYDFKSNSQSVSFRCSQLIMGKYEYAPIWIIELLNKWHINYRLAPEEFIEATNEYQ